MIGCSDSHESSISPISTNFNGPSAAVGTEHDGMDAEAVTQTQDAEVMDEAGEEKSEEGEAPRSFRDPGMPSDRERREHSLTLITFRSWCDDYVRGRGRDRQHRKLCSAYSGASATVPRVVMDYAYITSERDNESGATAAAADPGATGKMSITVLVMKETLSGSLWAYPVKHQGAVEEPWVLKQIMHDLDTVGIARERLC